MTLEFYYCEHCGNIAIKPFDKKVPLVCCGQKMAKLEAGTVDAAREKHVPVVELDGPRVHVEVGEVLHPMTEAHLIGFICLETKKGYQFVQLTAEDEPKADFVVAEGDEAVAVYEYCNLHGLWMTAL